jgi:uncharacterized protein (TIGR00251 family)
LIEHTLEQDTLLLNVRVVPRASRSEVVGEFDGALRVRIAAAPVDGAANDELIKLLAKKFEVPRMAVRIIRGVSSRSKQVRVDGPNLDVLRELGILKSEK